MDINGYALIIGGGAGIGRACAVAFAKEGAAGIIVADINLPAAQAVVAEIMDLQAKAVGAGSTAPFRAEAVHVDVTEESSVAAVTARMVQVFGRIDYCVDCVGVGVQYAKEIGQADVAEFDRFLDINVRGTMLVLRAVSAAMKTQAPRPTSAPERGSRGAAHRGAIVTLGSASSMVAWPGMVQYTASKFAVLGMSKNAALDNAPHGIRVNCVCPTWVDTDMVKRAVATVAGLGDMIERAVPFGRIAKTDEVADCVLFLCSPRSSYVTGCGFLVDGGTTLMPSGSG